MNDIQETKRADALFERVSALIEQVRKRVAMTVNVAEVYTKYHIGQYIVEDEQKGESRAEYEYKRLGYNDAWINQGIKSPLTIRN